MADRNVISASKAALEANIKDVMWTSTSPRRQWELIHLQDKPFCIETMSQVPMATSAPAMAAAQAIRAAQAQQAQSESHSSKASTGASEKVDCTITDSNDFAYIKYSKPEQATAALDANCFVLGGRSLNVEMAKSLPPSPEPLKLKSRSILRSPVHQSRNRRSKSLIRSRRRSPSLSPRHSQHHRSRSSALHRNYSSYDRRSYRDVSDRSRRPDSYGSPGYYGSASRRHVGRSPSPRGRESYRDCSHSPKYRHPLSRKARQSQHHTSRSPALHRHYSNYDRRSYRDVSDKSRRPDSYGSRGYYGSRDDYGSASRRHTGRSPSPRGREPYRDRSHSPEYRYRSSNHLSKSPDHHLGGRSSHTKAETRKRNRSKSADRETNPRVSHAKRKSVDGRRARSKSVEGGLKDENREEKHRRSSMNRSRSVSAEPNSHSGGKSS